MDKKATIKLTEKGNLLIHMVIEGKLDYRSAQLAICDGFMVGLSSCPGCSLGKEITKILPNGLQSKDQIKQAILQLKMNGTLE